MAVVGSGGRCFLINASPDISEQIERFLRPGMDPVLRSSPLEEIFITNADLDHSLGLLLLREGPRLRVTIPDGARRALAEGLRIDSVLGSFCGVEWREASESWREIEDGLEVRAVALSAATAPRYAPQVGGLHAGGYLFREVRTGRQAGIFPDVPVIDDALLAIFRECHTLLIDGTFWRDDELASLGISARTSREMGHVPISGEGGSLAVLAKLRLPVCVYLHINNTNPILDPASAARREVEAAGLRVAGDGMTLDL